jgi:DNA-binding beta-propeller fold protein YncE
MSRRALAALAVLLLAGRGLGAPLRSAPVLEQRVDIPLPGRAVRFDYESVDTASNRLYIAHMDAGELLIVNLGTNQVEGTVGDLPRVTGVWAVPSLGKVYASVPGRRQVVVIDDRTLQIQARVSRVGFPDGIAYAPDVRKVYVSDESGGGELVIDGRTDSVATTIPVGGEAGNTVYDPGSRHVFVAVQSRNDVAEIDPQTDRVVGRLQMAGAAHPHGMIVDPIHNLLFVANEGNATMLVVDLGTKRVVDTFPVGEDPDVLALDPRWGRLYVASESGVVSMFTIRHDGVAPEGNVMIPHAHSVAVDPRTHHVYLPLQSVKGRPVLRVMTAYQ